MMRLESILFLLFTPTLSQCFSIAPLLSSLSTSVSSSSIAEGKASPRTIAVTGATGRTGSLVVKELLDRGNKVVAIVRDMEKAKKTFPSDDKTASSIKIVKCDLGSEEDIIASISEYECDAAIWCATGFSDNPEQTFMEKVQGIFGVAVTPKKSIDAVGIPALAKAFQGEGSIDTSEVTPKVVMLSSAGVTRPSWDDKKKKMFEGCADIPIVRLNPFGILDIKSDSEERLRQSGMFVIHIFLMRFCTFHFVRLTISPCT
jgi:hypothetical protein